MSKTHKFETNGIVVEFDDNSDEVLNALKNAVERGLGAIGMKAVNYAQRLCPVDTGNLKGSITYSIDDEDCYIGTNVEYAAYVEFGTGRQSTIGGQQTMEGQKAQPYLYPSASQHGEEYRNILKESLKNA